jgi:hypothetical protein
LDHDGYLPSFAVVTEGKRSELEVARSFIEFPFKSFDTDRPRVGTEFMQGNAATVRAVCEQGIQSLLDVNGKTSPRENSSSTPAIRYFLSEAFMNGL